MSLVLKVKANSCEEPFNVRRVHYTTVGLHILSDMLPLKSQYLSYL